MKKTEIILSISSFVAIQWVMFFLIPGGSILLILSLTFLTILYLLFSFALFNNVRLRDAFKKKNYINISSMKILGSVATGFFLATTIMGILFKVMYWPGAYVNLIFGIAGLFVTLVIGFIKYSKTKSNFYPQIFKRIIVAGGIAFILSFIPNQILAKIKYRNYPEYSKALIDVMDHPGNAECQRKLDKENEKRFKDNGV